MNTTAPKITHTIAVRLFDSPEGHRQTAERKKILLLKLGERIGDFVTAAAAFRIIREAFADAEITLICLPSIVALAQNTGLFDRVVGFSLVHDVMQEGKVPKMDAEDQAEAFAELLDGSYFLAADFRHDGSTRSWLDYVDAAYRAGFAAATRKGLDIALPEMEWNVSVLAIDKKTLPVHAEMRLNLLAHAIVETLGAVAPEHALFPVVQNTQNVQELQALASEPRMKIGVCVGAGSELRMWQPDYWADLLPRLIQRHNAVIVFFGGAGDKAETHVLIEKLAPENAVNLTGILSLAQLAPAMGLLSAYIGCDTGLTHLAAKLGLPTVNIFAGISNVSAWRAKGAKVKTVYAEVLCAPCHLRFKSDCPNNNVCMKSIVPDIVFECFAQVVAA